VTTPKSVRERAQRGNVMRVICTEMYFDPSSVRSILKEWQKNPGLSVAWLHIQDHDPPSGDEIHSILDDKQPKMTFPDSSKIFDIFTDLSIQNVQGQVATDAIQKGDWKVENPGIVEFLRNADIVYENSPPLSLPLREIAKAGAPVVIGTFLGYNVADGNYLLMYVTIPGGIMVIGSAIGISRALENGLNKFIERLFKKLDKGKK
jgi:hypothetical protein